LANTIRTQIDLSNRLATAALSMGGGPPAEGAGTDGAEGGEGKPQRGGQNRRGRGGRGQGQDRSEQ